MAGEAAAEMPLTDGGTETGLRTGRAVSPLPFPPAEVGLSAFDGVVLSGCDVPVVGVRPVTFVLACFEPVDDGAGEPAATEGGPAGVEAGPAMLDVVLSFPCAERQSVDGRRD